MNGMIKRVNNKSLVFDKETRQTEKEQRAIRPFLKLALKMHCSSLAEFAGSAWYTVAPLLQTAHAMAMGVGMGQGKGFGR